MGFYNEISKYYDLIFPVSKDTVNFIKGIVGDSPKSVLDVACGTGGYSIELEKQGYDVTAIDLDGKMVEAVAMKAAESHSKVKVTQGDMVELKEKFDENTFDAVFCIGNSVVHLDNMNQISDFFKNAKEILRDKGSLIFQVINYDRIISQGIKALPTIYNESAGLTFERLYRYEEEENKVYFKTILTVKNESFENEVPLYALKYDETVKLLKEAGFNTIEAYGDFKGNTFYKDNSYAMIISGKA